MAITGIDIYQDNKVGDSDLMAAHSPLTFLIDVTYTGAVPDVLYCDLYDETPTLLATFKCIPYQDLLATERRFLFIADSIIRGYMESFDDFVQSENSLVYVDGITKVFELKFRDPDAGVSDESILFTAIQASRQFGENPNLTDIFNNESQTYLAPLDGIVYVYFYNDDADAVLGINAELLQLVPDELNIVIGGDTKSIIVTSNGDWLATEAESWISLTTPSGSGNGSFGIIVDANATGLIRTGTVTVTQGSLIKTVSVNQAADPLSATYDFDLTITEDIDTATRYVAWRLVDILPLSRNGISINVNLDYYLYILSAGVGNANVYYGIGSDAVTEPTTWILIESAATSGLGGGSDTKDDTAIIEIADSEFLFVKIDLKLSAGVSDQSTVNLELKNGNVILPGQGTAIASGDPLVWNNTINGPG